VLDGQALDDDEEEEEGATEWIVVASSSRPEIMVEESERDLNPAFMVFPNRKGLNWAVLSLIFEAVQKVFVCPPELLRPFLIRLLHHAHDHRT
jgi:hypothetical protein